METNGYHCHVSLTNNRLSPSILNGEPRLKVGERYYVRRSDDVWHPAKIIDVSPCPFEDVNRFKYKVHYYGCDTSLDEWVLIDRFHFTSSPIPFDDKATRNKNEEKYRHRVKKLKLWHGLKQRKSEDVILTKRIQFGNYEIDTWFASKYPGKYREVDKLFICEYCLKYMEEEKTLRYHLSECVRRKPPGTIIYSKDFLSVYEVDGKVNKLYCQFLCLLSKLFLDQKDLFYDVEAFLFYVLTRTDKQGSHLIGYFSKEKESADRNNLACILTLPPYQKLGYGKFLISLSYELAKLDHLIGSPEGPLSKLGKLSFMSYWSWAVVEVLKDIVGNEGIMGFLDVESISESTCIAEQDIRETLVAIGVFYYKCDNSAYLSPQFFQIIAERCKKHAPRVTVDLNQLRYVPLSERRDFDMRL